MFGLLLVEHYYIYPFLGKDRNDGDGTGFSWVGNLLMESNANLHPSHPHIRISKCDTW